MKLDIGGICFEIHQESLRPGAQYSTLFSPVPKPVQGIMSSAGIYGSLAVAQGRTP